jgi:hypothetical protein
MLHDVPPLGYSLASDAGDPATALPSLARILVLLYHNITGAVLPVDAGLYAGHPPLNCGFAANLESQAIMRALTCVSDRHMISPIH